MSSYGLNGNMLEERLMEKGIFVELVTGNIIMCMTGIGTTKAHVGKLLDALEEIAEKEGIKGPSGNALDFSSILTARLEKVKAPEVKISRPLKECAGMTCAASIIPYPPGIPLACPGEILTDEIVNYVLRLRELGEKVIGVSDKGEVLVGK